MITDHVWRPPCSGVRARMPQYDRLCEYMNCRRPIAEHARAVSGSTR